MHANIHTCMHTSIHKCIHACMYKHTLLQHSTHSYTHGYKHFAYTYKRTHNHNHTHTNMKTHVIVRGENWIRDYLQPILTSKHDNKVLVYPKKLHILKDKHMQSYNALKRQNFKHPKQGKRHNIMKSVRMLKNLTEENKIIRAIIKLQPSPLT